MFVHMKFQTTNIWNRGWAVVSTDNSCNAIEEHPRL